MPEGAHQDRGQTAHADGEALRRRDPGAWEALYERCGRRVRLIAHRILPPRLDPEAAAQQAWVRAIHRAPKLDPTRDPAPWLATICVNLCMSVLRRDQLARAVGLRRGASQDAPPHRFAGGEGHNPMGSRVREGVRGLSRDQQQIVYLRFACEMEYAEIAEVTGVAEATVRKRLSRAYGRLRTTLGGETP